MNLDRLARVADDLDGLAGHRRIERAQGKLYDLVLHLGVPEDLVEEAKSWHEVKRMILVAQAVHRSTLPSNINEGVPND